MYFSKMHSFNPSIFDILVEECMSCQEGRWSVVPPGTPERTLESKMEKTPKMKESPKTLFVAHEGSYSTEPQGAVCPSHKKSSNF